MKISAAHDAFVSPSLHTSTQPVHLLILLHRPMSVEPVTASPIAWLVSKYVPIGARPCLYDYRAERISGEYLFISMKVELMAGVQTALIIHFIDGKP
jgi:hypothetical protein